MTSKFVLMNLMAIYEMTVSTFLCLLHLHLNLIQHYFPNKENRTGVIICKVMLPSLLYYECTLGLILAVAADYKTKRRALVLLKTIISGILLQIHFMFACLMLFKLRETRKQLQTDSMFNKVLYVEIGYILTTFVSNATQFYLMGKNQEDCYTLNI